MNEGHPRLVEGKQITKGVSLVKALSSGGMGAVWLADHTGLKTQVVVKFMLVGLDQSESARTRFSREAAAAAQVKSPHVVQMLDHGVTDDGVPFIVMEYLEGHDLGAEIGARGALDPARVIGVVSQVGKALSKVHAAGLLHRDIKPDNIFLCIGEDDLFVKLLDFGIVKDSRADQGDGSLDGETKTGQVVGTPFYMSPEQVTAQKVIDHRSDLWSLGIVAYEALTGKRPYDGPSFGALAVKIATSTAPPPSTIVPTLPPAVDAWFAKACAREASARFASAREMTDALRMAFDGVVSLPTPSLDGDSGARGSSASRPDATTGPVTGPSAVPTLGLAATALDDSNPHGEASLGRSEAGVAVGASPARQGSKIFLVGVALLGAAAALVGVKLYGGRGRHEVPPAHSVRAEAASAPRDERSVAASTPVPAASPSPSPPEAVSTPAASAPTASMTASARPRPVPHPVVGAPPKPTESARPHPTARPTSTEPDLF